MSILDVTEEDIFHTLGRGRDPNFKPYLRVKPDPEKKRAAKKPLTKSKTAPVKSTPPKPTPTKSISPTPVKPAPIPVSTREYKEIDPSILKLTESLCELNDRMNNIQKMVILYSMPQYVLVLAVIVVLFLKS